MNQIAEPSLLQSKARKLIDRLRGLIPDEVTEESPADAAARRTLERTRASAEIRRLQALRGTELSRLAAERDAAEARLEAARPEFEAAQSALQQAQAVHDRRASDITFALDVQTRRIEAAADPIIEEVRQGLLDLLDETRTTPILYEDRNEMYDQRQATWVHQIWGNTPSVEARMQSILKLFHALGDLKVEQDQDGIRERMAMLVEGLPDPTVMVMVRDYPPAEPSQAWPTYRQAREELIGRPIDDDQPEARRSHLGRLRQIVSRNRV